MASAFLADCGIARVESLEALIEALPLVRRTPIRPVGARPPRVAVLTTTAGGAIMVVDPLAMRGVEIAQPSAETYRALCRSRSIDVTPARIVDLTIAGTRYDVMQGRARHPHHRARVRHGAGGGRLLGALPSRAGGAADHRQRECRQADRGVPCAGSTGRTGEAERSRRTGFPHARGLRGCDRGGARTARAEARGYRCEPAASGRVLDELEAYALLDRLGIPRSPAVALDATINAGARPALRVSGRREGPVRRYSAQDRSGRRRAERARRRRAASPRSTRCARP